MDKLKKFLRKLVEADTVVIDGEKYNGSELFQMMQKLFDAEGYYEFHNGRLALVILDEGHGLPVKAMLQWAEGTVLLPKEGEKYLKDLEAERIRKASGEESITLKDFLDK